MVWRYLNGLAHRFSNSAISSSIFFKDLFDEYDGYLGGLFLILSTSRSPESKDKNKNLSPAL